MPSERLEPAIPASGRSQTNAFHLTYILHIIVAQKSRDIRGSILNKDRKGTFEPPCTVCVCINIQYVIWWVVPDLSKRPWRVADHSPPYSAVDKNWWIHSSTPRNFSSVCTNTIFLSFYLYEGRWKLTVNGQPRSRRTGDTSNLNPHATGSFGTSPIYIYIYTQIRNTWKVWKCGAGEEWRRSVGPIMWEMKKCYLESMNRGISYMK